MFGFLYALFMSGASIINRISEENDRLRNKAKSEDDIYYSNGQMYYKDEKVYLRTTNNGHEVIATYGIGKIVKDLTKERNDKKRSEWLVEFEKAKNKAIEENAGWFCVKFYNYEVSTLKRFYAKKEGGFYYKYYFKTEYNKLMKENMRVVESIDYDSRIQITKEEYDYLGGDLLGDYPRYESIKYWDN